MAPFSHMADSTHSAWSRQQFDTPEEEIEFLESAIESLLQDNSDKPKLLEVHLRLGIAHHKNDDNPKAEEALSDVRQDMEEIWGWDHLNTQACVKTSVVVLESLERSKDAYKVYRVAIGGVRRTLGREYPWNLQLLNNFACLCVRNSDNETARDLFDEVYEAKRHVFGIDHKSTLDTLCNFSRVASPGKESELSLVLRNCLRYFRNTYGDDHIAVKKALKHAIAVGIRTGKDASYIQRLCGICGIDVPPNGDCDGLHVDDFIPDTTKEGRHVTRGDEENRLKDFFLRTRPKGATAMLLFVESVRGFVRTWMGMDISEFIGYLGTEILLGPLPFFVDQAALLDQACAAGHEAAVQALLDKWKEAEDDEKTRPDMQRAFRKGVTSGNKSVVQLLLGFNVNINARDADDRSALHDAAQGGHTAVVGLLLAKDADATLIDKEGDTPMDLAIRGGWENVVRLLMSHNGAILASSTRDARLASDSRRRKKYTCETEDPTGLEATVVNFYVGRGGGGTGGETGCDTSSTLGEEHRVQTERVEDFVLDLGKLFQKTLEDKVGNETYPKTDFRWIHLPANNVSCCAQRRAVLTC